MFEIELLYVDQEPPKKPNFMSWLKAQLQMTSLDLRRATAFELTISQAQLFYSNRELMEGGCAWAQLVQIVHKN